MRVSNRSRRDWRVFFGLSIAAALISAWFGHIMRDDGTWHGAITGVINSIVIATPILLLEIKGQRRFLRRLRRLPLLVYLGLKIAFYIFVILGGLLLVHVVHDGPDSNFRETFGASVAFAIAMSVGANLVFEMGGLLGFGTLRNLLTGRYVQPRQERRTFLLIDMKDSTGHAERLGAVRFHELLNAFFRDVTDAALECGAEIHKYVGDEVILTWRGDDGLKDGACLSCPFVVRDLIAAQAGDYARRYGIVPSFRASLHSGEIVAGEIGDVRREIAYVGDTLNVAARLLDAAKDLGHDVLASTDLLDRAKLPPEMRVETLPTFAIRGRTAPLGVSALAK